MSKPLFDSFSNVSAKEWKQKIQFDLKGLDYNKTLVFKSLEGIDIKPFYHPEDVKEIPATKYPSTWKIADLIEVNEDVVQANKLALDSIKRGVESISFKIHKEIDFRTLINGIPQEIPLYVNTQFLSDSFFDTVQAIISNTNHKIYLLTDIIGNLAKTGNWYYNLTKDHEILKKVITQKSSLQNTISVDIGILQNAGATIVQQLAYGLAHANEYLNFLENCGFGDDLERKSIVFKVSVGGNYFFEIAKIKALRILWEILSSEYNMLKKCYIFAQPSLRNKTILDYNVNMLRTTTECMSAILGGADVIRNIRYDEVYNHQNEFGNRISSNQLLILKNESYFDHVDNAATGSYYIEYLTKQFIEKSLELFKNIEKGGGYLQQLKSGIIQQKVKESADQEQALFDKEDLILTGANVYRNPEEIIPEMTKDPFLKEKVRKTLLNPVILRRLSEKTEKKLIKSKKIPL